MGHIRLCCDDAALASRYAPQIERGEQARRQNIPRRALANLGQAMPMCRISQVESGPKKMHGLNMKRDRRGTTLVRSMKHPTNTWNQKHDDVRETGWRRKDAYYSAPLEVWSKAVGNAPIARGRGAATCLSVGPRENLVGGEKRWVASMADEGDRRTPSLSSLSLSLSLSPQE